ncbi:hypothetical protein MNBD_CHLOROFLEXI01-5027 [hydrothermal vent metagenome]|uniref:Uncharacterized protein n=1 Tax=hydrothermal vent metagenome TaxID=652676 RepID=A0A3B0UKF2_9ZZZZ
MKKAFPIIILFLLLTAIIHASSAQMPAAPQEAAPIDPIFPGVGVITSRHMEDGRISTSNQAIFGPSICINFGDPYSPLNSPFAPGPYTYQFRIRIPADYPSNIVRVELFDPDSINQAENSFTIIRSNIAINNGLTAVTSGTCTPLLSPDMQMDACLLETDELTLVDGAPNLNIDQINPFWIVRVDENRGVGDPPGNGLCGSHPHMIPPTIPKPYFNFLITAKTAMNPLQRFHS